MDPLFELSRQFIRQLDRPHRRPPEIPPQGRCHLLTGPRGTGKSTWTVQALIKDFPDYESSQRCLYLPSDHFILAGKPLYEVAEQFARRGGELLCLDEVHRAEAWARDLKSMADTFPSLRILATGSSLLHLQQGSHDLSRRFLLHRMIGLSFREYLLLRRGLATRILPLEAVLTEHETLAPEIQRAAEAAGLSLAAEFQDYLRQGYYPYSLEIREPSLFIRTLQQSALTSLEGDLPAVHPNLSGASVKRIHRLLAAIAMNIPFPPDLTKLRRLLHIADDRTLKDYLAYLEDAELIFILRREGTPFRAMDKPDRIYLGDPNLCHALAAPSSPPIGAIREIFLLRALPPDLPVCAATKGDFLLDGKITLEVGGPHKDAAQIRGLANAFLALDDLPVGSGQRVPLWLFGFLR